MSSLTPPPRACRSHFPLDRRISAVWEPTVAASIVVPTEYVGGVMQLCSERRGAIEEHSVLGSTRTLLRCEVMHCLLRAGIVHLTAPVVQLWGGT